MGAGGKGGRCWRVSARARMGKQGSISPLHKPRGDKEVNSSSVKKQVCTWELSLTGS